MSELNDEGKEKVLDYIKLLVASGLYKKKAAEIIPFRRVIKLYDTPVSAGVGNFLEESEYISIEVGSEVSPAADFGVRISGDSMEPQYINGQYAYVHSQQFLDDGEIATGSCSRTVGRIERGERNPSLEMAIRIARYFNLSVEDVFDVDDL